ESYIIKTSLISMRRDSDVLKSIANPAERLDEIAMAAELTPYGCDVDVHRAFGDLGVFPTHGIDDLIAREHPSRSAGQKVQDVKLCWRQLHQVITQADFVAPRMDDDVIINHSGFGIGISLLPTQHRFDPCQEHAWTEGFGEIIIGSELEPRDDIRILTPRRQHHDRNHPCLRVTPQRFAD